MKKQITLDTRCITNETHRKVVRAITQPITATQLSRRLGVLANRCSKAIAQLRSQNLVKCLNPNATRSRLFCLTKKGIHCRQEMDTENRVSYDIPEINWEIYATLCFSHRSHVMKTLSIAMQPSEIKRRATFRTPGLKMSANNVRDVIRYLKFNGIVFPVKQAKRAHPRYELTETGLQMRQLLLQAEVQR